jgi:hypothetical protein
MTVEGESGTILSILEHSLKMTRMIMFLALEATYWSFNNFNSIDESSMNALREMHAVSSMKTHVQIQQRMATRFAFI